MWDRVSTLLFRKKSFRDCERASGPRCIGSALLAAAPLTSGLHPIGWSPLTSVRVVWIVGCNPTLAYIRLELTNRTDSTANRYDHACRAFDLCSFPITTKFGTRAGAAKPAIGGTPTKRALRCMGSDAGAERLIRTSAKPMRGRIHCSNLWKQYPTHK